MERVGALQRGDGLRVAYQVLAHIHPLVRQVLTFASVARAVSVWGVMSGPIPVAAPLRVHDRLRGPSDGPRRVVHASSTAVYVDLDGWCLGLVSATATRVPCALWSTLPDLDGLDPVAEVQPRHRCVVGDRPVRITRLVDPRVPRVGRHEERSPRRTRPP